MSPPYELAFAEPALEFLLTLPLKTRTKIIKKARALKSDPTPPTSKQLKGKIDAKGDPIRRERSGDYRILYVVRDKSNMIMVLDIGHRKNIYI